MFFTAHFRKKVKKKTKQKKSCYFLGIFYSTFWKFYNPQLTKNHKKSQIFTLKSNRVSNFPLNFNRSQIINKMNFSGTSPKNFFSKKAAIFWGATPPSFPGGATHPSKPHKINNFVVNFCLTRGASHIKFIQRNPRVGEKISTKLLVIFIS